MSAVVVPDQVDNEAPDPEQGDDAVLLEHLRDDIDVEESISELVRRYQDELIAYFYHHCWRQDVAEDLAQTVFIKVFKARKRYQRQAKVRTFLYRIAHNAWVDHVRRSQHQPLSLDLEVGQNGRRLRDVLPGDDHSFERFDEQARIRSRVQVAVEALPEHQRSVFVLANNQGLKYQQIGEVLGIPEGTVKSRMHAAVRNLRASLEDLVDS